MKPRRSSRSPVRRLGRDATSDGKGKGTSDGKGKGVGRKGKKKDSAEAEHADAEDAVDPGEVSSVEQHSRDMVLR
jgi:hypothetical protein